MSQTWDASAPVKTNDWDDDILAMKNKFDSLQSSFSGTSAPTSPVIGQLWADTTDDIMKVRNFAGTGWDASLHGDSSCKIWIYRNDTNVGMVIDATVSDRVLAIKGGSNAYNVNGGNTAGTWTQTANTWTTQTSTADVTINIGAATDVSTDGHNHSVTAGAQSGVWRPAAAVGTMQYPDL